MIIIFWEQEWDGQVYGTYGGDERYIQDCGGETWGKETTFESLGIDGRIVLKLILKK
jgi:hypothetical protein